MTGPTTTTPRIPITILTGFTGSGKTTLLLNTLPQLKSTNPSYTLALIKNEIGDVAVDSQLASSAQLKATQELLGDCICCTNVGQIEDALATLDKDSHPDRIVIETSGSAEPLKLVLEVNRLAKATGRYELDGIVSVIDAENWSGYASKSFTAKLQAQQTDLIVVNKWEALSERELDDFLDRLGDLDVETPQVRSSKGVVSVDVLFGLDGSLARGWLEEGHGHHHHGHGEGEAHTQEIECLSVTLTSEGQDQGVDLKKLDSLLRAAPKDEVYRIKAVLYASSPPQNSDGSNVPDAPSGQRARYLLNWSFGRWTWALSDGEKDSLAAPALRMSIFTAPYESNKWTKKVESGQFVALDGGLEGKLEVKRVQ